MSRESGAHFVLYDDASTLAKKLQVARSLDIPHRPGRLAGDRRRGGGAGAAPHRLQPGPPLTGGGKADTIGAPSFIFKEESPMVRHIVSWNFKPELTPEERREAGALLAARSTP